LIEPLAFYWSRFEPHNNRQNSIWNRAVVYWGPFRIVQWLQRERVSPPRAVSPAWRAAAVARFLIESGGVAGSRVESVGYGESQPVAPNDTPANKALNRRVEALIIVG
jgi:hypothetical protein